MKQLCVALMLMVAPWAAWAEKPLDKDLGLFMEYFEGEFNNYNQVNFETNDFLEEQVPEEARHPWHHHTLRRVEALAFGEHVYFAQTNAEGPEGDVVRQRVYVLEPDHASGTIQQHFYAVDDPIGPAALAELTPDSLRSYPEGCEIVWRRQADQFSGEIAKEACRVVSRRSGKPLHIAARMVLSRDEMWHLEEGFNEDLEQIFGAPANIPYKLRRARYFSCWVAFLKDEEADDWDFFRDVRIHDQGGVAEFTTTHDEPRHYRLQLTQTAFPAGAWPDVLELFVYEKGNDRALSYAWTARDSDRIGINLRWMQTGCGLEP